MTPLISLSRLIDKITTGVGRVSMWLILACTVISAGNAIVRKMFNVSSNGLLEIQWYLFAAIFLMGAGYGFLNNSHVRIDFIASRLTARTRNWIDVVGIVAVLFPFCLLSIMLSWPLFTNALASGEMSQNAGGLIRWPVYALIPLGFALLAMQGVSELIKRIAFLKGKGPDVLSHETYKSDEEIHLEELAAIAARKLAQGN
ncbi:MAG: TRAP transporter small permease subunit [Gammaproteobacteria bacterium]|uniref:TRAP transporter small permease subunit n=1 Tax=Rhodoferax sp. TaxID=50421 RepID=UPI0018184178|nr:TRAP transporter small permease subunit [Rhodoferax sp.]MBU3899857.1 TRAP transporter small permease subunit [Gammaproteobacteria bacterium]MBA3058620.1 TRAP transporter small permease subunit [Rhodoferax sp.]MBU3996040.1 TRAP transporter small permease subunit [Gammaproteobacteria bacterium]MBU4019122.1 TRAP transporter small permease subunit [Gammaproteobacteria bacterium]MBU4078840.1 TRAP transporter small permease subunit [Gammaproteobacteria bacterium]